MNTRTLPSGQDAGCQATTDEPDPDGEAFDLLQYLLGLSDPGVSIRTQVRMALDGAMSSAP
jgi:hypothetical protein